MTDFFFKKKLKILPPFPHPQFCSKLEETYSGEELEKQKAAHASSCCKNFDGSSGAMEIEAVRVMWGRSKDFKIRYIRLLGDGDGGAHKYLENWNPYGPEHPVKKLDCVNHVAKR